jgi:glycosyltransferase involved in cell wall biosynthesis
LKTHHNSRVRILHTIRQGKIGGGESHVLDLIQNLDKSQFEPIVLSFTDGPMVSTLRSWGVDTHVIYTERAFDFSIWGSVKQFFVQKKIDIVHAHGTRALSNVFRATKQLKLPLIYTVHGWSFHQDQKMIVKTLREASERFLTRRCDQVICVSNSNKKDGEERLGLQNSIIINYGINIEKFDPEKEPSTLKSELGISHHQTLVGYLVRMTIQKDPHTLIRAIAEVAKETTDIKFLIVGDGDLKESTVELARTMGVIDNIIFQNFRQDIPHVLAGIDIYCLPSLWEGLPIGLLEAMAMKKAIVATPVDGTKEAIKDGLSGMLVPHQSPTELAKAILFFHNNKDKLQQFGMEARKTIENSFEVKRMTRNVEQVYERFVPKK